jgi:hypothetical protein
VPDFVYHDLMLQFDEKVEKCCSIVQTIMMKQGLCKFLDWRIKNRGNSLPIPLTSRTLTQVEREFWPVFFDQGLRMPAKSFLQYFFRWLKMEHPKMNTFWLYGTASVGKTFFMEQLLNPWLDICVNVSNQGIVNDFALSHLLKAGIIIWEEPFCDISVAQDMKNVLGGKPHMISRKFIQDRQMLTRKPVFITSNYKDLQHGVGVTMEDHYAFMERTLMLTVYKTCIPDEMPFDSFWCYATELMKSGKLQ